MSDSEEDDEGEEDDYGAQDAAVLTVKPLDYMDNLLHCWAGGGAGGVRLRGGGRGGRGG